VSTLTPLTDAERDELIRLIQSGQPLLKIWRGRLCSTAQFPNFAISYEFPQTNQEGYSPDE
jgi:hypothetical protein